MSARGLPMWVVYDHPKDYPDSYVARLWEAHADGPKMTESLVIGTLESIRETLTEMHLIPMPRSPADDLKIVEIWL